MPFILTGLLLGAGLTGGSWFWARGEDVRAMVTWSGGFALGVVIALLWALPLLDEYRPSRQLVEWVRENAPPTTGLAAVKYQEPSLVFYWAENVEMIGTGERYEGFALLNRVEIPTAMVITAQEWEEYFRARYSGWVDPQVTVMHEQEYFYFEKGRWERMLIIGNWSPVPSNDLQPARTAPTDDSLR